MFIANVQIDDARDFVLIPDSRLAIGMLLATIINGQTGLIHGECRCHEYENSGSLNRVHFVTPLVFEQ